MDSEIQNKINYILKHKYHFEKLRDFQNDVIQESLNKKDI